MGPIVKDTFGSDVKQIFFDVCLLVFRGTLKQRNKSKQGKVETVSFVDNNISNFHCKVIDETCYLLVLLLNIAI